MRRRLLLLVLLMAASAVLGYAAWSALQVRDDLQVARTSAEHLAAALEADNREEAQAAASDLRDTTSRAADRTDGPLWSALTWLPLVGDDAEGVRALTRSLDTVSRDGVAPIVEASGLLKQIQARDGVDLDVVADLQPQVAQAGEAVSRAHAEVADLDSSGYAGPVKGRFEEYVDLLTDADAALRSAETATEALPAMLGAEGPRDYLLIFQNNAEIRATGGLPGAWALMHAEDGELSMAQQGTAGDFPVQRQPVLPMSKAEQGVFTDYMGRFFQNSNMTPDFPRSADLWRAHWNARFPETPIDGVISLDPVAMSYLLEGTGPITAAGQSLTGDNLVEELLRRPYIELDPVAQDALFAGTARAIFDAVTGDLRSPLGLVEGLSRAADEGRLLIAPFDEKDARILEGSQVLGALPADDGETPNVDIALNDVTMSKMSYYLRYGAEVSALRCEGGRQQLEGSIWLRQAIAPNEAAALPDSVVGQDTSDIKRGEQIVNVAILGPHGGVLSDVRIDGKKIPTRSVDLDGRPAMSVYVFLDSTKDAVINWTMETGVGQTARGEVGVTPGIVRGDKDAEFASAC